MQKHNGKTTKLAALALAGILGLSAYMPGLSLADTNISTGTYTATDTTPVTLGGAGKTNISGGSFIRADDGATGAKFTITSAGDMNISGGNFSSQSVPNYAKENNVVIKRDDNVRLYEAGTFDPVANRYYLPTEQQVRDEYAKGEANIKKLFSPKNNPDYIPTLNEVLAALKTVSLYSASNAITGWNLNSGGNLNVTGGNFNFNTLNGIAITAAGKLNWANANLVSKGGGAPLVISAPGGINISSGSLRSEGSNADEPYALNYDNRGRLDRERWTLGKYMYFMTDGDITLGVKGSKTGPEVYYSNGMMFFNASDGSAATGKLYLYSGSLTLDGQHRSTLNTGNMVESVIDGGTLNVFTHERINRVKVESASMWLMPVRMESGAINLVNSQLGGESVVMNGGVITALGDSAINSTASGKVALKGGEVNLGNKAYIGAIKGDSKELSAYVTATKNVELGSKVRVNLDVSKPTSGNALTVGTNIGGIYAIAPTPTSITLANSSIFTIANPLTLDTGKYTAEGFIEASNGTVTMDKGVRDERFYSYVLNKNGNNKADMLLTVKDAANVISSSLSLNSNVSDNAGAFKDLLRNAKGNWTGVVNAVVNAPQGEAAELLRQVGGENATAAAQNTASMVSEFRGKMHTQSASNISGMNAGDSVSGNGYRGWITGMGSWASQGTRDGVQGYDAGSGGLAFGFDTTFAERYTVGLGLGYASSYANSKDGKSTAKGDTFFASLYGSLNFNPIVIDADLTYANTMNKVNNSISAAGIMAENEGEYGIDSWSAGLKASYIFEFNNKATKLAPYVGIEFLSVNQHGYSESGPLAREFGSDFSTLWTLPVGIKLSHQFRGDTWAFTPEVGVGYARDLNEFKPASRVTVAGMGGSEITTYGSQLAPDSFRANAGFAVKYKENLEFYGMYKLDARDSFTNHGVNVGFSYSF